MNTFQLYFTLGREHILDYSGGYDHILFIIALCGVFLPRDWKRVLILVTAFTVGHSVTLALATLGLIPVNRDLIEFLIPLTIFVTAASNLFRNTNRTTARPLHINYFFALFFGLIHGMGFSSILRTLLGQKSNILLPLFAFNLGLEFGQIVVVVLILVAGFITVDFAGADRRDWKMVLSAAVAGMALILLKERAFF